METLKYNETINYISEIPNNTLKEKIEAVYKLREEQIKVDEKKEQFSEKEKEIRLEMEISERKAKLLLSFFEKESVATIIGAVLLIIMVIAQLVAMFTGIKSTDILNNSFLLILGYFFGQSLKSQK